MSDALYLLDTNVVSETRRRTPDRKVVQFLEALDARQMFLSVLTLGELRKGVEMRRRTDPIAADLLSDWVQAMETDFADRVVPVDAAIAGMWGRLSAIRPRPVVDTILAATALVNDFALVTRNLRDVADTGVVVVDPWQEGAR